MIGLTNSVLVSNRQDARIIMRADKILMIPHLSKELSLIGFPSLPYSLKKIGKTKSKNNSKEEALEIIFNGRQMIGALTSTCLELIKQIKRVGEDENNTLDKLHFENIRLQKQLQVHKSETEKVVTELSATKKAVHQLQKKVDECKKKLKQCEIKQQNTVKRNQTNENILKHTLQKKESEVFELHKVIWKKFKMANQNYLPQNYELIQLNQADFSKFWGTVRYSNSKKKEEALKKALYMLQNNNTALMEENFSLKTLFLSILQEMHEMFEVMIDKMHIPNSILISFKIQEVFEDVDGLNTSLYISILKEHFNVIRRLCELFDKSSFTISDDLFVCWSSITESL